MKRLALFIKDSWISLLHNLGIVTVVDLGEGVSGEDLAALSREVGSVSSHQWKQDMEIDQAKKRLEQQEITLRALKAQVGVNVPRIRRREPTHGNIKSGESGMDSS